MLILIINIIIIRFFYKLSLLETIINNIDQFSASLSLIEDCIAYRKVLSAGTFKANACKAVAALNKRDYLEKQTAKSLLLQILFAHNIFDCQHRDLSSLSKIDSHYFYEISKIAKLALKLWKHESEYSFIEDAKVYLTAYHKAQDQIFVREFMNKSMQAKLYKKCQGAESDLELHLRLENRQVNVDIEQKMAYLNTQRSEVQKINSDINLQEIIIHRKIGAGQFKEIYKVEAQNRDKMKTHNFAMTYLELDYVKSNLKARALVHESEIAKLFFDMQKKGALVNVVSIHEIKLLKEDSKGACRIIFYLCEHGDLATYATVNKLDFALQLRIICDVFRGIKSIHANGFVHQDIKLSNVFISDKAALIGDFGTISSIDNSLKAPLSSILNAPFASKDIFKQDHFCFGVLICDLIRTVTYGSQYEMLLNQSLKKISKTFSWIACDHININDSQKYAQEVKQFIDNTPFSVDIQGVMLKQLVAKLLSIDPATKLADQEIEATLEKITAFDRSQDGFDFSLHHSISSSSDSATQKESVSDESIRQPNASCFVNGYWQAPANKW